MGSSFQRRERALPFEERALPFSVELTCTALPTAPTTSGKYRIKKFGLKHKFYFIQLITSIQHQEQE